jgi:hypothetical protein
MGAQTNQIDFVFLRVVENLSVRRTFSHRRSDIAPELHVGGNHFLQSSCCLLVTTRVAQRLPSQFRFANAAARQIMLLVQLGRVLGRG